MQLAVFRLFVCLFVVAFSVLAGHNCCNEVSIVYCKQFIFRGRRKNMTCCGGVDVGGSVFVWFFVVVVLGGRGEPVLD